MICLILFFARTAAPLLHADPKPSWIRNWCSRDVQNLERASILKWLEGTPGAHLVIVRFQPNHDFILDEWVFNNADIDDSKVVWARDMGAEENYELIEYFKNRHVWLVEPNGKPARVMAYPEPAPSAWLTEPDETHRAERRGCSKETIDPCGSDTSVPSRQWLTNSGSKASGR